MRLMGWRIWGFSIWLGSLCLAQGTMHTYRLGELDSLMRSYLAWEREGGVLSQEGEVIDVEPEVYEERLGALNTVIPLPLNAVTLQYIRMYLFQQPVLVGRLLGLEDYYLPTIERILRAYGLPSELKYLPIIESALVPEALSPMAAAGIWQFIPSTARLYGLQVSRQLDERYDLEKSTHAAARYLRNAYQIFGDWLLVIAAYNCGQGRVLRAIKLAGGRKDYWEIAPFLPAETRGYVPAFVAACYIMNYAPLHGIRPIFPDIPREVDTVYFPVRARLSFVARQAQVPLSWLRFYNAELRADVIPAGYTLRVPAVAAYEVAQVQNRLVEGALTLVPVGATSSATAWRGYVWHLVRPGESLYSIARRYEVSPYQLLRWNQLWGYRVYPGMRLKVRLDVQADSDVMEMWQLYREADAAWSTFPVVVSLVYMPPRRLVQLEGVRLCPQVIPPAPEAPPVPSKKQGRRRR